MSRILFAGAFIFSSAATAALPRDRHAIREFRAANPCPLTGKSTGPCRSGDERMVIDHVWPLCGGGRDAPENMRWQEYRESLVKDRAEVDLCRWMHKGGRQ